MTFPIVGIAASAGGLEAVSELLGALPARNGMAYVVVQHLDPGHKSLLTELLQRQSAVPVTQVTDRQRVEADRVFVIPPATSLTLVHGEFRLEPRVSGARHMPADAFLRSLAADAGEHAIAVVLSGGDSDGTLGVQAVKDAGGITFAQEPLSAQVPSMPRSAIGSGHVDFVLRPAQIAAELGRLGKHPYLRESAAPVADVEVPPAAAPDEEILRRLFRLIRAKTGMDFGHYKRSTLLRRLNRRMALRRVETVSEYLAFMQNDPAEIAALFEEFLISVTSFFREPDTYDALSRDVFPRLFESRGSKDPFRIWVPGCATGEEVYSIAISLLEYLGGRESAAQIQIFGTDVSEPAIQKARSGYYPDTIVQDVSADRIARFFVKQDGQYRIAKSIRDLCIFARHDVTHDPPFSRLDLISCRNLLIYLDTVAQLRVMRVFHYSLQPHGVLMLGSSESVGQASNLFELADKHHRFFTRKSEPAVTDERALQPRKNGEANGAAPGDDPWITLERDSVLFESDRLLLARYAPASVLVDDSLNVLQFRGETGAFLEHASGVPSLNLQRLVRPGLLVELSRAVDDARASGFETRREGLCTNNLPEVSLEVIPICREGEQFFLILFDDGSRNRVGRDLQPGPVPALPESEKDRRLVQLENELAGLRDYLQATMEKHESIKEELKSAHEEVLSANEEFQSTNEELETSKEELQSTNEELTTTIEELGSRNRELAKLNEDIEDARSRSERARLYADAIVDTVRGPLIVLDGGLKVLRANRAYYENFSGAVEESEGKLLRETGDGLWDNAHLRELIQHVLTHETDVVDYEITHPTRVGKRHFSVNARRIVGDDGRPELILLALDDITEQHATSDFLRESNRHKDEFLAMLAHELRNPLGPILNAMHLLRRADADPDVRRLYAMVERQTQRMSHIVDELLDIARIDRGLIDIKREPVDMVAVSRSAADAARLRTEEKRQILTLALPEGPMFVEGDAMRLEQVVSNLLDNAIKYTDVGGRISLTVTMKAREVALVVRDNGIGLAPDKLDAIFDLFAQADRSLARSSGGLGIGLNVARRLTELHGGRIEARSAGLGQGSEFILRLPALHTADAAEPARPDARQPIPHRHENPQRILIVDDNADSAESMAMLVRLWGHDVVCAADGPAALALTETFRPETALLDIGLPGMDGYELARRMRVLQGERPIYLVAMTGYGREEDRADALAAGFDLHLVKPATAELEKLLSTDGLA